MQVVRNVICEKSTFVEHMQDVVGIVYDERGVELLWYFLNFILDTVII